MFFYEKNTVSEREIKIEWWSLGNKSRASFNRIWTHFGHDDWKHSQLFETRVSDAIILLMMRMSRGKRRERDVLVQKLICPRLACDKFCDDNFDLLPQRMLDVCMIHSCVREWRRKSGKGIRKQENNLQFYFHRQCKKSSIDVRFKNLWKIKKDCVVCVRERERKKINNEKINYR